MSTTMLSTNWLMWIDYYTHKILCLTCWIFHKILNRIELHLFFGSAASKTHSKAQRVTSAQESTTTRMARMVYILYSFSGYNIFVCMEHKTLKCSP